MKTILVTVIAAFMVYLTWLLYQDFSENNAKTQQHNPSTQQVHKNNRQQTIEELRSAYVGFTDKEKESLREKGLLFPDEVNPEVHTKIEDNRYLQQELLEDKAYRKIRLLIDSKVKKIDRIIAEHNAFRLRRYGSEDRRREVDFSYDRDENLIINTPLQAYKHLLKNGKSATGEFPVKYHEDNDYYIFLRGGYKTKDFSEGVVVEKKGGLFFKWRLSDLAEVEGNAEGNTQ